MENQTVSLHRVIKASPEKGIPGVCRPAGARYLAATLWLYMYGAAHGF